MNIRPTFYESSVPFDSNRIHAAAVYCSDGRFGAQFDEFMRQGLKLPRYDRLAIPGGAACLASHFETYREEEGVGQQLEFLVKVHGLQHVVLIAQQDCAFHTKRLNVSDLQLETIQYEDMQKPISRVREIGPELIVDAFFARKTTDGVIQFDAV